MGRIVSTLFRVPRRWLWHLLFRLANGPQTHIAAIRVDFFSIGDDAFWIQEQTQAIRAAENLLARAELVHYQKMVTKAVSRILFINFGNDGYEATSKMVAMKWRHGYSYVYLAARLVEFSALMSLTSRIDREQAVLQADIEMMAFLSSFPEGQQTAAWFRKHWRDIGINSQINAK